MDFELTEEQTTLKDTTRKFMQSREVQDWIYEAYKTKNFPRDFMGRAAEHGYLGMNIAEKYGGAGMSYLDALIAFEEIAYASIPFSLNVLVQNSLAGFAIETFGTLEHREKYLPRMVKGELFGCFANTEPEAGSDAKNIRTRARWTDKKWVINGTKRFITNASEAGVAVIFTRTMERRPGHPGITAFLVEIGPDISGFSLDKIEEKNAQRGSTLCQFTLTDFVAHEEDIIGGINRGWEVCEKTFLHSRLWVATQAVGAARYMLDKTVKYVSGRNTFGEPIIKHQYPAFELAKAKVEIEAARLLIRKAACQETAGDPEFPLTCSMAKYLAGEMVENMASLCYRYHGGMSIATETAPGDHSPETLLLDSKIIRTYEGPSEIMLKIISDDLRKSVSG